MANSEAKEAPYNPWREFIENVIDGSNYFRASEYRALLDEMDSLYADRDNLLTTMRAIHDALEVLGDCENLRRLARAAIDSADPKPAA